MSMRLIRNALLAVLVAVPPVHAQTRLFVRDPNASFLDVAARRKLLASATTPRRKEAIADTKSCITAPTPAPPPRGQDIPSRYQSGSHGALNPDEHTLSLPYYRVQDVAAWGADRYLLTGDPAEANCVIKSLLPWARSHALLDYNAKDDMVVWFQSTWTVASLSLAVSVIRAAPSLNIAERDEVIAWLRAAAHKALSETRGPASGTSSNNHFFWRGLAATAAGVISQDDSLFRQGIGIYATAIGEMDPDGSFPAEMQRHELALHYQAFAIEPLVMIAELANRQGFDIYPLEEDHHRLADAVGFLHRAILDPSLVKKYAAEPQQLHPDLDPGSQLLAWVEFYRSRTHSTDWDDLLQKPFATSRLAGSATLYAAPVHETPTPPATP
jgi:poly(beta-D-mannuronate) lyase